MRRVAFLCVLTVLGLVLLSPPARSQLPGSPLPQSTLTVSGTVTGPDGPVAGVWVGVGSPLEWQEATTNGSGFYSVSILTDGQLWFEVRPALATRLAQVNHWVGDATGSSYTQDFSLVDGYLLDLGVLRDGTLLAQPLWIEVLPLVDRLPEGWWYSLDWNEATHHYRAVLPVDIYYATVHDPPAGTYETTQAFDLRSGDRTVDLSLSTTWVHPIPYDPPEASHITVGPPNGLGEAIVTGAAGAALPLAQVLLVNLNSAHQAGAISAADGSFSAQIYAPPGSAVMVKHGPASSRWNDLDVGLAEGVNPFPGTVINVPHTHTAPAPDVPFAAAGGIDLHVDDANATRNYVGAAWAVTGTVGPVIVDGEWEQVLDGTYAGAPVPGLYLGGLNWTHPAPGDLDADGDLDLLVGERSGRLVLYRNGGTPAAPAWQFEAEEYAGIDTGGWAYPALADVTGDGVLDLFVGAGDGTLSVYYNQGAPSTPVWPEVPDDTLSAGPGAAPALADLDADGDPDLLAGNEGGSLYYFKNTGTLANPTWTFQTSSYGGVSEPGHGLQPSFVDLDADGDLDLLIGRSGDLVWYRRDGTPANPTWTRMADGYMGFGGSSSVSPGLGDWDGDGDRDLVTGEHWGVLRFFRNDGPPAWTELIFELPFDLAGDAAPALADWDADGDLDLLVGQVWGNVEMYTNAGTAAEPDWQADGVLLTLPWTDHPHAFPALADVDADGDQDLFVGEGGWQGPGAGGNIHYYRNDGTPSAPSWTFVTDTWLGLDVGGWSRPVFADIDADGDLDLFVGDEAGTLTFVRNTGTSSTPAWASPVRPYANLQFGAYSAPAFFDLDGDGDLDLLVGQEDGSLAYVRNTGTASSPAWEMVATLVPGIEAGAEASPTAGDLDGDGSPDLLLGDGDGGLRLYLYLGPGAPPGPDEPYEPGDLIRVEATLRIYGPGITAGTDPNDVTVNGWPHLMMLFDAGGHARAAEDYYMGTLLTPTGFPIQGGGRPGVGLQGHVAPANLRHAGDHAVEGDLALTVALPDDLPPGIYRPVIWLGISGVPTSTQWLAANVTFHTFWSEEAPLPPITVGQVAGPRVIWRLMMDDFVEGTRGAGAREDQGAFELASQITSQGAPFYVPAVDARTGQPLTYRLEPFLPMISYTDRRLPTPPLLPFDLPGGQMCATLQKPDGTVLDLGCEAPAQSFNRTRTTRAGSDLNAGTVQIEDVYSLQAASDRFRVTFDQYGHHVVTLAGTVEDLWGNSYEGGGTYDVWVAEPLDVDPGVLPGTPLAAGDAFNPALRFSPGVPADVILTLTHYPDSDPAQVEVYTVTGTADRFGYLGISDPQSPVTLADPGEYRFDLAATYTAPDGTLYMGAMTWGGVVMTPAAGADLVAHGRRGLDSLSYIPNHWFVASRDLTIPAGAISHTFNPYYNGDVLWSRMSDGPWGGDSLLIVGSVQDTVGVVEAAIEARVARMHSEVPGPGSFPERVAVGELPLFISTRSGRPPTLEPGDVDQVAYSYRSSQRPGVRVREVVSQDNQNGGYWRLDTLYDDQLSVGIQGDLPNDFKFQYVGAVYRDLDTGRNEYLGQGTGWVFLPDDDALGSRVMPPFAGPGNGGWTTEGGPLLTLKGEDIHIFLLPTGVQPGAVLEVGDTFRFAGHIMPTLDSQVAATVTAPGGATHQVGGQANHVGYFYDPGDDFIVDQPGLWSVDVSVWHDGQCSGGQTVPPYPSGDVLGSESGRYWFYVVPDGSARLDVSSPDPGFLTFGSEVTPITISGMLPAGLTGATVDYTIQMPGYILAHGQATIQGSTYRILFDPAALQADFPNLDLLGRDTPGAPGLSDTFAIGLLLQGQDGGSPVYRANTVTIQGDRVYIGAVEPARRTIYLPLVVKGG